ncbi:MAG TPA: PilN domain-containing protein [Geobacteraceae bacterium]|nr:PilN domain-containing protein [Geobacteraceae bacterium]
MRLTINLATRIHINMGRLNLLIAGAIALLLLLLTANALKIAADFGEIKRLDGAIALLEGKARKSAGAAVPDKDYQALLNRIRFANAVIERKSFDWLTLFDRLESVVPDGIVITALDPSAKDGGMKLNGMAKGFGNLRKLVENLEDSKFFGDVYLVSHAETQVAQSEKGIGFQITCRTVYK